MTTRKKRPPWETRRISIYKFNNFMMNAILRIACKPLTKCLVELHQTRVPFILQRKISLQWIFPLNQSPSSLLAPKKILSPYNLKTLSWKKDIAFSDWSNIKLWKIRFWTGIHIFQEFKDYAYSTYSKQRISTKC